jgi:GxxExxY protein
MKLVNDDLTESIIGAAISVHQQLGPGMLESSYEACLSHLLLAAGMHVERQKALPAFFRGRKIDCSYRIDLLVERSVVVEVKNVERFRPVHTAQMLTYLRWTGCSVGLLLNFNVPLLKEGIRRVVLKYSEDSRRTRRSRREERGASTAE